MGSEVVRAVEAAEGLELVATCDVGDERDLSSADVAVDFTHPEAVMDNLRACVEAGVHAVVGTTGFDDARLAELRALTEGTDVGILVAPNFGIAAVLMMQFAAQAARYFDSVEIVELHHPNKADAPSGTARRTAELVAAARQGMPAMPDATSSALDGAGRRARRRRRRRPGARGAPGRPRRAPGGAARRVRRVVDDPARQLRPGLLHAGRPARRARDQLAAGRHRRPRAPARPLTAMTNAGLPPLLRPWNRAKSRVNQGVSGS